MKKIPTIFERDWDGDRSRVIDKQHPDCAWVFAGEGVPTRKLDGTCCLIKGGKLYKRRELKPSKLQNFKKEIVAPPGFEVADYDATTDKVIGWMPVGDGPEDKYHREAFLKLRPEYQPPPEGTFELIGAKVQGGTEEDIWGTSKREATHFLVSHRHPALVLTWFFPHTFEGIKALLTGKDIEGIVWHHPDGRFAKVKLKDFGLRRTPRHDA